METNNTNLETEKIYPLENIKQNKNDTLKEIDLDTSKYKKILFYQRSNIDQTTSSYYIDKKFINNFHHKDILYYYRRIPNFILYETYEIFRDYSIEADTFLNNRYQNPIIQNSLYLENIITKLNTKHGFLKLKINAKNKKKSRQINLYNEIALFKSKEKDFVLISYMNCSFRIHILEFTPNKDYYNYYDKKIEYYDSWRNLFGNEIGFALLNSEKKFFYKLPEYGITILAYEDKNNQVIIEDPDAFWEEKLKNHPEDIIYLDWQTDKGKFVLRK